MLFLANIWKIIASYAISKYNKSKNIKFYIPVCERSLLHYDNFYNYIHSDYDYNECDKLKWFLLYTNSYDIDKSNTNDINKNINYNNYIRNVFLQ